MQASSVTGRHGRQTAWVFSPERVSSGLQGPSLLLSLALGTHGMGPAAWPTVMPLSGLPGSWGPGQV